MGVPKLFEPQVLLCPGGQETCHRIPAGRGWIETIIVRKAQGPACDFTVQFFSSENACGGGSESDSEDVPADGTGPIPPDNYAVTPPIASSAREIDWFAPDNGGTGYLYSGAERKYAGEKSSAYIWVKISPAGIAQDVSFAITLGMDLCQ